MKKYIFSIFFILFGLVVFAQEIEDHKDAIPRESKEINREASPFIESISLLHASEKLSPFNINRYKIEINLLDIGFPSDQKDAPLDMLAVARAEAIHKKSASQEFKASSRQLQQIRNQVQVFTMRQSDYGRAHNDLQFDSKMTPDGGIRNNAWQDIRQPFVNPYYGIYGQPNPYDYRFGGGHPGNSLYFYRR